MRMLSAVLVLAATATTAHAEEAPTPAETEAPKEAGRPSEKGTLGLGLIFGEPTGITGKLYLKDDQAVQGAFGASFYADAWQLHGEYVWHPWILQDRDTFVLPVYLGPGMRFIRYNGGRGGDAEYAADLRAVAGLLFDFKNVPLDVFIEVGGAFGYNFSDSGVDLGLNIGAGIRYYP
ncbi:MAG TPA: hypothetical protein VFV99_05685 [Kofleriaceae bacterium]|nr:hypothetical protein [Kofleriaceae bacterium]